MKNRYVGIAVILALVAVYSFYTREIYNTGRGSFKLRAKWNYLKEGNLIEITEIPYSTATEVIMGRTFVGEVMFLLFNMLSTTPKT